MDIYRRLAEVSPDAYMPNVATTLNNLGLLQSDLHRYEEAEQNYLEALDIYRRLAEANSDAYMPDVADTLWNLAILEKNRGNMEVSYSYMEKALPIYEQLELLYPGQYADKICKLKKTLES